MKYEDRLKKKGKNVGEIPVKPLKPFHQQRNEDLMLKKCCLDRTIFPCSAPNSVRGIKIKKNPLLTCSSNSLLTSIRKSPCLLHSGLSALHLSQSYSKFLIELKQLEDLAAKSVRFTLLGRRRNKTDKSLCVCVFM